MRDINNTPLRVGDRVCITVCDATNPLHKYDGMVAFVTYLNRNTVTVKTGDHDVLVLYPWQVIFSPERKKKLEV